MNTLLQLRSTPGSIAKLNILNAQMSIGLQTVFMYAYDYNRVYGIKQMGDIDWTTLGAPSQAMFDLLDDLIAKRLTGNAARDAIANFADLNGDLIKLIVRKDLDCGVSATTFNKVIPGRIPQFKIQKAKEIPLNKIKFPCLAQIKYDGVRILIVKQGDIVSFRTSSGKEAVLPKLSEVLRSLAADFVLDSEVTTGSGKLADRSNVSGMINSAMHGGTIDESLLKFHVFDCLMVAEWQTQTCLRSYKYRYNHLVEILASIRSEHFIPANTTPVATLEEAEEYYKALLELSYEGAILKTEEHRYTFKRSKDWVKLKETKSADLMCVSTEEGTGKYEGQIGALTCVGEVEGKEILVKVGSGLSDTDRMVLGAIYINKVIEVKYNSVVQDSASGQYSLFLPRFVCIRHDKS